MRSERNGASDDAADLGQRSPEVATVRNRRHMVGAVAGGFALAVSGLLLPEAVIAETEAVDLPVRREQQRANNRRHRRHKRHPHNHDSQALAVLALSRSQGIPSDTQAPIRFDTVLTIRGVSTIDHSIILPERTGHYQFDLVLTWSGSGVGSWETGVLVNDEQYISSGGFRLSPVPTPGSFSTVLFLKASDSFQVVGRQNSAAEAQASAGAMVLEWVD